MSSLPPEQPLGLYCHVPFCASTCDFCNFYQEKPHRDDLERYLRIMELEFSYLPSDRKVTTVFWGGGTPGLLTASDLERLGTCLLDALSQPPEEWTVEMAPSTVKPEKIKVLRDLGVTRISMGVQSFQPELLKSLGRLHNPKQIYRAWECINQVGCLQSNLDLIFAIPNQTIEQLESDLREAARLGPTHISTYCLTFEEDTALYVKLSQGKISTDEDRELRFYERTWALLADLGFEQYEISNFAKPGGECVHNINTWKMYEWIGCGPSAASQFEEARYRRPADLDEWCHSLEQGVLPKTEFVRLDDTMLFADAVIFGLRMSRGINLNTLSRQFPNNSIRDPIQSMLHDFANQGLLELDQNQTRLTHRGRLLCDRIGRHLLEL